MQVQIIVLERISSSSTKTREAKRPSGYIYKYIQGLCITFNKYQLNWQCWHGTSKEGIILPMRMFDNQIGNAAGPFKADQVQTFKANSELDAKRA